MNIFEQDDYKEAIKLQLRSQGRSARGSFRKIAEYLGVHATLISQILSGPKDFTEEQIFSVCEFLGLGKLESNYLWMLVQIERAGSVKLRDHYLELKSQLRRQALNVSQRIPKQKTLTDSEKALFYSSWIYSAVQVATTLQKKVDFNFICEHFDLPPSRAREILDFLIRIQLITESNGLFLPGATSTHLDNKSPFIVKHHTNWRLKAIEAAETLGDDELIYSANFSISKSDFTKMREEMVQLIQKFLKVVGDSPAEEIAQFNLDFLWVRR